MTITVTRRARQYEVLQALYRRICCDFGQSVGEKIIKIIIEELGGLRIRIPDFEDLYRPERDRKIRNYFNGTNYKELAIMFGLSVVHIRRIVNSS